MFIIILIIIVIFFIITFTSINFFKKNKFKKIEKMSLSNILSSFNNKKIHISKPTEKLVYRPGIFTTDIY